MMSLVYVYLITSLLYTSGLSLPQSESLPENTCNACCQGVAGVPGVPGAAGIPGHNGFPGRDGIKGDRGEPSLSIKGEKGDTGFGFDSFPGPQGPKGDRGEPGLMGMPGKIGPNSEGVPGQDGVPGQKGDVGEPGLSIPGRKGDKGEPGLGTSGPDGVPGQKGEIGEPGISILGQKGSKGNPGSINIRRSAFTAIKTHGQTGTTGEVITFQELPTNINNAFNLATNQFTCQIAGVYHFTFSFGASIAEETVISLLHNNLVVVSAFAHTGAPNQNYDHISNSAILNLSAGDMVWLAFGWKGGATMASPQFKYSSFSGFLLYEN